MPNPDLAALLELHPPPWTIHEDWQFGDQTPLTVVDGYGSGFLAIAGHAASMFEPTDARDHIFAETLMRLVAGADARRHSTS